MFETTASKQGIVNYFTQIISNKMAMLFSHLKVSGLIACLAADYTHGRIGISNYGNYVFGKQVQPNFTYAGFILVFNSTSYLIDQQF
jgi:hypothetical protein